MKLQELRAVNFRNYHCCQLPVPAMINVFYGNNAQGKTNLLEAIFYGAFGCSHRTNAEEELVGLEAQATAVTLDYSSFTGMHQIKIKKYRHQSRWLKEIFLDGAKVKPKDHYGALNAVMFSPEDLQLVKGEPALRRKFFDMQIAQTDPLYYELLVKYNRVLQQRNKLLKDLREQGGKAALLGPWNQEFASLASAIVGKRLQALKKLQLLAAGIYGSLTGQREQLELLYEQKLNNTVAYEPSDYSTEAYLRLLVERQQLDIFRGNTGIGPHRDDLLLRLNGRSLKAFGSQGQQRTGALALKLSQLEYVYQELGEYPLLLLDDVMSELDNHRRQQLLQFIDGRVQTFITVNDKELIPALAGTAYFKISNGTVGDGLD